MWLIILGVVILGIVAAIIGYFRNRKLEQMLERGEIDAIPEPQEAEEECCGAHELCEKDSLLAAVSKDIEYYDDEDLDRFRGRHGDEYTDEEVSHFGEVFYTLKSEEVAGWLRSLQLRGIELPDQLKDEALLVVSERRIHP